MYFCLISEVIHEVSNITEVDKLNEIWHEIVVLLYTPSTKQNHSG